MGFLETIRRVDRWLSRVEDACLAFLHAAVASLVCAAVAFRYALNDPLTWSEELIILLFGWMIFLGVANAFRMRTHIIIDVRTDMSAEEVFEFFRAELTELGWTFARTTAQQGRLLQASGRQGDFGIELVVLNRAVVRDDSDWGSRLTVYQLRVAAAGRKGE